MLGTGETIDVGDWRTTWCLGLENQLVLGTEGPISAVDRSDKC